MLAAMPHLLSTADVEPRQRVAFWTDLVCDTYVQLECDAYAGAASIDGEIVSDRLATLSLSTVTATAQQVRRTKARIADASEDYFLVSIQTQGRGVVSQDGRDALLGPGDFALYDSTRPYTLTEPESAVAVADSVAQIPVPACRPCRWRAGQRSRN